MTVKEELRDIDSRTRHIVIVGGGSAGWITAGLLASEHGQNRGGEVSVTLVESPDVKTIGVGEGTWPTMRGTLNRIGLSETEFLTYCSASFKQGTKFVGWVDGKPNEYYYHPFAPPAGYSGFNMVPHWLLREDHTSFTDTVTAQGQVCDHQLAPKQEKTPEFAAVLNYGYHLDAGKFAELLQTHCTQKLGVRHVLDHVQQVNGEREGDIVSITTAQHGDIEGDLFIDCTGFKALLLGEHYGVKFQDMSNVLFNDRALAMQLPYRDEAQPIASQTISTAQESGWVWDIALSSRRGVGYTYSSRHSSEERAREALAEYVKRTSHVNSQDIDPRLISFRPGYRECFWHRNCVAVGLSAGFLEPLEASALVMIELSARAISEDLPVGRGAMDVVGKRFNENFSYRWARIIDFLKLHYVLSQRTDTAYWTDIRDPDGIPQSLKDLLAIWRYRPPQPSDLPRMDEIFSTPSYLYVLYGMGYATEMNDGVAQAAEVERARQLFDDTQRQTRRLLTGLPGNREILQQIAQQGLPATAT